MNPGRRATILTIALAASAFAGCGGGGSNPAAPPPVVPDTISPSAAAYLNALVDIMQANSINRLTINWVDFRARVFASAPRAKTVVDLYPAIRTALEQLADGHSSYRAVTGTNLFAPSTRDCRVTTTATVSAPSTVGYIRIEGFTGLDAAADGFAQSLHEVIRAADRPNLEGWIVDLRGNLGGNMWPMLAGVGPILGEGTAGHFIDPVNKATAWGYAGGGATMEGEGVLSRAQQPYTLIRPNPRVAVLTDLRTTSSGEAIVIAFRGRANTRSFGTATCGSSTGNDVHELSDGAQLILTEVFMADRAKTRFGVPVPPDEVITDSQQAVDRAIAWLRSP